MDDIFNRNTSGRLQTLLDMEKREHITYLAVSVEGHELPVRCVALIQYPVSLCTASAMVILPPNVSL